MRTIVGLSAVTVLLSMIPCLVTKANMQANERERGPDLNQDMEMKTKKNSWTGYLSDFEDYAQLNR